VVSTKVIGGERFYIYSYFTFQRVTLFKFEVFRISLRVAIFAKGVWIFWIWKTSKLMKRYHG